ncbi:HupE/UreJ family protein [uncultured Cytophaga sp.]|uniref:HupE/UreJ family protein n=1 Tax=uncultured Cytophaga sp. TaxID=160238 RepID=UPI002602E761|nr:HupE/UreJ family protein [uncultured Cytophaga sp.]
MQEFTTYLLLGFEHISDIKGFDHILFILTLCCIYSISEWKRVLVLITAFTIGHSITLLLSALKIIVFSPYLIEILIPVTILITSISNLIYTPTKNQQLLHYLLALFFGCIHGMGFSNFFSAISMNDTILIELASFNIGLEIGQICIVLVFFMSYALLNNWKTIEQNNWKIFFSGAGASAAIILLIERI